LNFSSEFVAYADVYCALCVRQVNTINREVLSEFKDVLGKIQNDSKVRAVVISSTKPDCFIAGADITYVLSTYELFTLYHDKYGCILTR